MKEERERSDEAITSSSSPFNLRSLLLFLSFGMSWNKKLLLLLPCLLASIAEHLDKKEHHISNGILSLLERDAVSGKTM